MFRVRRAGDPLTHSSLIMPARGNGEEFSLHKERYCAPVCLFSSLFLSLLLLACLTLRGDHLDTVFLIPGPLCPIHSISPSDFSQRLRVPGYALNVGLAFLSSLLSLLGALVSSLVRPQPIPSLSSSRLRLFRPSALQHWPLPRWLATHRLYLPRNSRISRLVSRRERFCLFSFLYITSTRGDTGPSPTTALSTTPSLLLPLHCTLLTTPSHLRGRLDTLHPEKEPRSSPEAC